MLSLHTYKKFTFIAATLVALATLLVYLPALQNGFVKWDDHIYVYENQNIQSIDLSFLKWVLTVEVSALWHPLTMFSLALDYAIWELNPFGYHLTNILLHSLNTFLVFILVVRLMKCKTNPSSFIPHPSSLIAASVTALLFGIHPLHVESVAWVSERKDVLCAFFFLMSIIVYLRYTHTPERRLFYAISLISFVFALMSKSMAVSLPIVLLIIDLYPLRRLKTEEGLNKKIIIEKLPFLVLSLLTSLTAVWAHQLEGALQTLEYYPFAERMLIAGHALAFYLLKMGLLSNLAPYYSYPAEIDFFTSEYIGSFILLGIISILCILLLKRYKLFSAIWVYYIVTLIPVIGIVKVGGQAMADRYTYLPSLGPFLLAGLGVGTLFERYSEKRYQISLTVALALVSSILGSRAITQMAVWKDSITLWSYEINLFPDELTAYNNRGNAYIEIGEQQLAIKDYDTAINLNPKYTDAYYNRGNAYREIGEQQLAIKDYDTAINLNPKYTKAYNNRGEIYDNSGNHKQAIMDYSRAIELNPLDEGAYNNRGIAYGKIRNYHQAIDDFSIAIKLNPKDAIAYRNRGIAYKNIGNHEQALKDFNKADELNIR